MIFTPHKWPHLQGAALAAPRGGGRIVPGGVGGRGEASGAAWASQATLATRTHGRPAPSSPRRRQCIMQSHTGRRCKPGPAHPGWFGPAGPLAGAGGAGQGRCPPRQPRGRQSVPRRQRTLRPGARGPLPWSNPPSVEPGAGRADPGRVVARRLRRRRGGRR